MKLAKARSCAAFASVALAVTPALVVTLASSSSCVPEVGTQTRGGECEGPGSKPCRGNLECMAGRCACRLDVCNGGNCNREGECIPPAPGPSFPKAQSSTPTGPAFPTAQSATASPTTTATTPPLATSSATVTATAPWSSANATSSATATSSASASPAPTARPTP